MLLVSTWGQLWSRRRKGASVCGVESRKESRVGEQAKFGGVAAGGCSLQLLESHWAREYEKSNEGRGGLGPAGQRCDRAFAAEAQSRGGSCWRDGESSPKDTSLEQEGKQFS